MESFIQTIQRHPYYKVYWMGEKPIIVYEDHRFVVPILWLARQRGLIDSDVNMVRFDAHMDAIDFDESHLGDFQKLEGFGAVFDFCHDHLKREDDDWVTFALHQKLFDQVLTFCDGDDGDNPRYAERMFRIKRLDGILDVGGEFSDVSLRDEYGEMWDVAGWNFPHGLNDAPVLLDFDCDYFAHLWRGLPYSWADEFFEIEFCSRKSSEPQVSSWSNLLFARKIVEKAPFVTICLESEFCGGLQHSRRILQKLNTYLFDACLPLN